MSYYALKKGYSKKSSLLSGFVNKLINTFVDVENERLDIKMRYVDILRGEDYLNDLREVFQDKYPIVNKFELGNLIMLLYLDFIRQIKSGRYSHKDAANFLLDGKQKYLDTLNKPKPARKEIQRVSPNTFIFEVIEDEDGDENDNIEESNQDISFDDIVYLEVTLDIRQNNRCKVLLYDIEPFLGGVTLEIQDVIAIRYLNFIEQVRLEGNNQKIMKAFIKKFSNEQGVEY